MTRATEWDAQHWGFDDSWMEAERSTMDRRAHDLGFWPEEVSGYELGDTVQTTRGTSIRRARS